MAEKDSTLIRSLLVAQGYPVLSASGKDLLEPVKKFRPDLIIVDSAQDESNSLKTLRNDVQGALTPVFAIIDAEDRQAESTGFEMGVKDYLYRPITPKKLAYMLYHDLKK